MLCWPAQDWDHRPRSIIFSTEYVPPADPLVKVKLAQWQDLKFGLFMHWGTYSQWGVVESWSICPEDEGWTQRRGPYAASYNEYKKAYENLQKSFKCLTLVILVYLI